MTPRPRGPSRSLWHLDLTLTAALCDIGARIARHLDLAHAFDYCVVQIFKDAKGYKQGMQPHVDSEQSDISPIAFAAAPSRAVGAHPTPRTPRSTPHTTTTHTQPGARRALRLDARRARARAPGTFYPAGRGG